MGCGTVGSVPEDAAVAPPAVTGVPSASGVPTAPPPPPEDAGVPVGDAAPPTDAAPPLEAGADAGVDSGATARATLPRPTGTCPAFSTTGTVRVQPAGVAARNARIWVSSAAATMDGPLVFYWHGTGGAPTQAEQALGLPTIQAINALGGVVIAPEHDPAAGTWPWFLVAGVRDDDLVVADELVACAAATIGVDPQRIHSTGFSAGGLQTTVMSFRRASYLASVVSYSGGLLFSIPPARDAAAARFAALIFHGGATDTATAIPPLMTAFQGTSETYFRVLDRAGDFPVICNHGAGHSVPASTRASALQFLLDHPFDTPPSPYAAGLPAGFFTPCALTL